MRQFILLLITTAVFTACDKITDDLIDPVSTDSNFNVLKIDAPNNFVFDESDSSVTIALTLQSDDQVGRVYFDVLNPTGKYLSGLPYEMFDNGALNETGDSTAGDNIFSTKFNFERSFINGIYDFNFIIADENSKTYSAASFSMNYYNGQTNYPPIISNLIVPDSVNRGVGFVFSIDAFDPNGYEDLKLVYFRLYRPDGTIVIAVPNNGDTRFQMYDDGVTAGSGDETAGDGRFSLKNSFGSSSQTGYWRFEFEAIDQSDSLSNKIIHNIKVK